MEMDLILQGAVPGLVAALTATAILGIAKGVHQWWAWFQDVRYLRDILIEGRKRVMEAKDTPHQGMGATSSAGAWRAALYNNMIKKLSVALEKWLVDLSHNQRKDIFDALNWYHTDSLLAIEKDEKAVFVELPDGKWPATEMPIEEARNKFEKLQAIKWLKLRAYQDETV